MSPHRPIRPLCSQKPKSSYTCLTDKLEYAATQYEIVSILIEQGKYEAVIPEFRRILKLGLEDETLVASSALDFAAAAIEREQYGRRRIRAGCKKRSRSTERPNS